MGNPITRLLLENIQPRPARSAWHGGPTASGALRGVRAEQARWRPAPGRKCIWELTVHIAYWKYAVRRRLTGTSGGPAAERFPRTPSNWARLPEPADERAWKADVELLRSEHQALIDAVTAVPLESYARPTRGGRRWTYGELILGIAQHDAYHVGQIQLMKKLWNARNTLAM